MDEEELGESVNWEVRISGNAAKRIGKLPYMIQERFKALALELKAAGPVRDKWANYGKIQGAKNCHHCHIRKGKPTYVAVWKEIGKNILEVTYVGTHEKADYRKLC